MKTSPGLLSRRVPLELSLPKGAYSVLEMTLDSGRVLALVIPGALSSQEAAEVKENLEEIRDIVAGWQAS
jgi:hypothetical protein